jgi:hypothetical protein
MRVSKVRLGERDLREEEEVTKSGKLVKPQDFDVEEIIEHEKFLKRHGLFDIALIK